MASEIKVDTISEKTSAGGVTIDGLLIKDGNISGDVALAGTTPTFTIGDAGAEDATLLFDGNAQDYHVGLDDSSDSLVIGLGSSLGTTPAMTVNSSQVVTFAQNPVFPDGGVAVADLDIDGATDIGAAVVDADLFIIDDGAGGTNRKVTASRIKTYAGGAALANDSNNRVVTADGSGGLNGEANCTFDGSTFTVSGAATISGQYLGSTATDAPIYSFTGDTNTGIGRAGEVDSIGIYFGAGGSTPYASFLDNKGLSLFETAPQTTALGALTVNQGANDHWVLDFKNSDVAHGMTDRSGETDSFCTMKKFHNSDGGIRISGFGEDNKGLGLYSYEVNDDTTKATTAIAGVYICANKKSGAGSSSHGTDGNLCVIADADDVQHIFDKEGTYHANQGSTTFDAYDDAQLARAYDISGGEAIKSKFDKFITYNASKLADLKLIGREEDGTPNKFVNITGMQKLHNGAIWQQYEKHERLLEAVYDLAKEAVGEEKADAILDKHEVKRLQ